MFGDEADVVKGEIEVLLETFTFGDILEENDMDEVEALYLLWSEGFIKLPEIKPL
jgi:hypothetical protein